MANEKPFYGGNSDVTNPYSFHHLDHPRMILVSKPLNGDNYSTWCKAMVISLNAKSTLGFIGGTTAMPSVVTNQEEHASWKKMSRYGSIMNS